MTRPTAFATPIVALALCSLVWLSSLAPALATTVTDTLPLKGTGTKWCRDDPKFFDTFNVKILDGNTLTLTRDVLNTGDLTDIQATINTHGGNATIDAITLNGRALPANKSGSTAQLVLSGRDPGNPDHFMTLRGTAIFNKAGKLTKVTGTFVYQFLSDFGGIPNVDCFEIGTFATGKKPPPSGGGADIDVTNATPASGNTNISGADITVATSFDVLNGVPVTRVQVDGTSGGNQRQVLVYFETATGAVQAVSYSWGTASLFDNIVYCPAAGCTGMSVNMTTKEITLANTALDNNNPFGSPDKFATLTGGIQYP